MSKQNTPLTNVIEWIDERLEVLEHFNANSNLDNQIFELLLIKNQLIKELPNEREKIIKAHSDGVVDAILVEINECKISSQTYFTQTYKNQDDKNNQSN